MLFAFEGVGSDRRILDGFRNAGVDSAIIGEGKDVVLRKFFVFDAGSNAFRLAVRGINQGRPRRY